MGENSSLSWARYQHVLLVAQSPGTPPGADWSELLSDANASQFKGILVFGEGSKLSALQRADVENLLRRNHARNAVVTSSPISRGVVTALEWFGLPVKAFAPTEFLGALDYLKVSPEDRRECMAVIERLQRSLVHRRRDALQHSPV